MKTRQEMIYEFMVASANGLAFDETRQIYSEYASEILSIAEALADKFLENAQ